MAPRACEAPSISGLPIVQPSTDRRREHGPWSQGVSAFKAPNKRLPSDSPGYRPCSMANEQRRSIASSTKRSSSGNMASTWIPQQTTTVRFRPAARHCAALRASISSLWPGTVSTEVEALTFEESWRLGRACAKATAPRWGLSPPVITRQRSFPIGTDTASSVTRP